MDSFTNLLARASKRWFAPALCALTVMVVVAGFVGLWWVDTLPQRVDEQQTIVVGQTRFAPDSDASVRVVVQDFSNGQPIAGVKVKVRLKLASGEAIAVYEGETDETGSLPVSFHVPADAAAGAVTEATLIVETLSAVGQDRVEQPITIEREYRLLLTSDKPLYQPGQVIHMRALALSTFDLTPARGATFHFLVEDAKGNKVYRKDVTASDFGIAAVDFLLADMVNQGSYKLSVSIGDAGEPATRSEKTVEVRPYVLPRFGVEVVTDRSFYLPGQRVEGVVQADYFFGKPVAEGKVRIVGSVWDVERVVLVELLGQTDENGAYEFSFDLPEYFAGSGLDLAQAQFALEVTVVDQTDHAEQTSRVLPIAAQPLIIEAVAESGVLKPGVENIVYVLTSYPDGRPAPAQLQIGVDGEEPVELASGEFGLAQFTFTPSLADYHYLNIVARDETGLEASRQVNFETEYGSDSVLLRADRAAYVVGETMSLVAFTPVEFGSIYLDIVKDGQTLSTRSEKVEGGRAEFAVDVSADLYGTLELHAYKVLLEGTIVRDTRVVVVDAPNDIAIAVTADQDVYLPGELATMDFQTTGEGGGVQTALGLAIVDESVFALQRQDPGFAKLYFMLEQELMEPFYQIKGFELPAAISPEEEEIRLAQDDAVKASWVWAPTTGRRLVNSRPEKLYEARLVQFKGFEFIEQASAVGLILIPLVALALTGYAQAKGARMGKFIALPLLAWPMLLYLLSLVMDRRGSYDQPLSVVGFVVYLFVVCVILIRRGGGMQRHVGKTLITGMVVLVVMSALVFQLRIWTPGGPFTREKRLPQEIIASLEATYGLQAPSPPLPEQPADQMIEDTRSRPDGEQTAEPPRLRQYFPETLYWAPEVLTDESGFVSLEIPMADSITTWRLMALASSQDGRLGFTTRGVRVFQDFFVDIDLPGSLTQGDEISIPVGVFNYLPEVQEVRLVVEQEDWFELLGEGEQTLTIASNDIDVVYFPIRVLKFGRQGFQVTAWGEQMRASPSAGEMAGDAIRREVTVVPDGKEFRLSESDWLRESADSENPLEVKIEIPTGAVPGTGYVEVKVYPGVMAQAVEGLEKILRLPHG